MSNSSKHLGVEDYNTIYTTQEKMDSFRKSINLSSSTNKEDILKEPYLKDENVNMVSPAESEEDFFYVHLPKIYDRGRG